MHELSLALRRLRAWWSEGLWAPRVLSEPGPKLERAAVKVGRTIYIVATGFRTERIKLRASLLTYTTLLSLVPALVVVFSVFAAFQGLAGVQGALKRFIVDSIAVNQQETVMRYLDAFVRQAGALGTAGTLFLLVTTISLLVNIETAFNDIWGIARGRSMLSRFQVYWPLVTLGPILVGLSLSLTAAVEASSAVRELLELSPVFGWGFELTPVFLTWTTLTLLYMLLPNTHVPFRAAAVGGVVAGTLWELAKQLYALYAGITLAAPSVYGSLAAVPLFILWIYVSWIIALLGATLTFAVQNAKTYEPESLHAKQRSQRDRELLAGRLVAAVSDSFERGSGPVPVQVLLDQVVVSPRFARRVLAELVEAGVLVETDGRGESAFVPARPLESITLADVVHAMRGAHAKSEVRFDEADTLGQRVCRAIVQAEETMEHTLSTIDVASLLDGVRHPRRSSVPSDST